MKDSDDVEMIVRRCNAVRELGDEYGEVSLSPYIQSLLRVTRDAVQPVEELDMRLVASV